jgi:hypothetical protein
MSKDALIDELTHNANNSGNQILERRLADLGLWFHMNKDRIPMDNLAKRLDFMEKAMWTLLEIDALLLQRIREKTGSKLLYLPSGMMSNEGRKFG